MTDHAHTWDVLLRVERAPIDWDDPIAHTGFIVIGCPMCRRASAFPMVNYTQTITPWQQALDGLLAAAGYEFSRDESVGPMLFTP